MNPFKRYWLRWNVRRYRSGDRRAMERLHWLNDPWDLDSREEHFRFRETTGIIQVRIAPHFGSILEIGCAEGLQTQYLAPLADTLVGIDASEHAVRRARLRGINNARFEAVDLAAFQESINAQFDLATACEVLYYLQDVSEGILRMSSVARICLATYYEGEAQRLDKLFWNKCANMETIRKRGVQWRIVWWNNP